MPSTQLARISDCLARYLNTSCCLHHTAIWELMQVQGRGVQHPGPAVLHAAHPAGAGLLNITPANTELNECKLVHIKRCRLEWCHRRECLLVEAMSAAATGLAQNDTLLTLICAQPYCNVHADCRCDW